MLGVAYCSYCTSSKQIFNNNPILLSISRLVVYEMERVGFFSDIWKLLNPQHYRFFKKQQ